MKVILAILISVFLFGCFKYGPEIDDKPTYARLPIDFGIQCQKEFPPRTNFW